MNKNYELNNPVERARLISDTLQSFKDQQVILFAPAALTYTFNNIIEGICYVIYHTIEVDDRDIFMSCIYDDKTYSIIIRTSYGSYILKLLSSCRFDYKPNEDELFINNDKAKINIMNDEFSSSFSTNELEQQVIDQSLAIVNTKKCIDTKMERFLNRYFANRWQSYRVEARYDGKYVLVVKYDGGQFELKK